MLVCACKVSDPLAHHGSQNLINFWRNSKLGAEPIATPLLTKSKKASRETNAQTTKPTTRPLPRSEGKQRERGKQESAPEARRDKAKQNDTQSNPAGAKNL